MADVFVELARAAIEQYISRKIIIPVPSPIPKGMEGKAGVFVSLHKFGDLRGCIGTFMSTTANIAEEVIAMAIEAATSDLRFMPIKPQELSNLEISVDVLGTPEEVPDKSHLNPKIYGIIVSSAGRRGLLLPDLEGVDTVEEQVSIAMRKAGIHPGEAIKLQRFRVTRHH
jgi:AmmeMemoRadiSam system protein A